MSPSVRLKGTPSCGDAAHPSGGTFMRRAVIAAVASVVVLVTTLQSFAEQSPDQWRAEKRLIDMHMHINPTPEHLDRAVRLMDEAGIGVAVNLGVGTATPGKDGGPSQLEAAKK